MLFLTETVEKPDGTIQKKKKMHPVYEHIKAGQSVFDNLKVKVREKEGIKAFMDNIVDNRFIK